MPPITTSKADIGSHQLDMVTFVTGRRPDPPDYPTFADGHYALTPCEAIEKSARSGKWVRPNQSEVDQ